MYNEKDTELIDLYLNGALKGRQLSDFEKRLADDPEFKEEVQLQREINNISLSPSEAEIRATIRSVIEEKRGSKIPEAVPSAAKGGILKTLLPIAVAAAALIGVVFYFATQSGTSIDAQDVLTFEQSIPLPQAAFNTLNASTTKSVEIVGEELFNAGEYTAASNSFKQVVADEPKNEEAKLFLALSYWKSEQNKSALAILEALIQDNNSLFSNQAIWYKARIKTGEKKWKEAEELLLSIPGNALGKSMTANKNDLIKMLKEVNQ